MNTKTIPSVGSTTKEVWQAWEKLSKGPQYPNHLVYGWAVGDGTFSWIHGEIVKNWHTSDGVPVYAKATKAQIDDIHHAIEIGTFQIEARTAGGTFRPQQTVKVYHQATGIPPKE